MSIRWILLAAVVGMWAASAGCSHYEGPYCPVDYGDEQKFQPASESITMLDKSVRNALQFQNSAAKRLPTGQIQVQVQMLNMHPREVEKEFLWWKWREPLEATLWADVRFVFYKQDDASSSEAKDKVVIVDQTEWQTVTFPSLEIVPIKGTSLRNDTTSFNVQFKNLRSKCGNYLPRPGDIVREIHVPVEVSSSTADLSGAPSSVLR